MKLITVIALIAITLFGCSKQAKDNFAPVKKARGHSAQIESTLSVMSLTHNSDGTYSVDYGGATDVIWMFFRWGDTLSTSGNVIPQGSISFYQNPVTTFDCPQATLINKQAVIVTGSLVPDANGVVGADWVTTYTNVVQ